ncbi:hypothetical protein R83H12_02613 [Fibrobacteria bacterium R8-3-H12]
MGWLAKKIAQARASHSSFVNLNIAKNNRATEASASGKFNRKAVSLFGSANKKAMLCTNAKAFPLKLFTTSSHLRAPSFHEPWLHTPPLWSKRISRAIASQLVSSLNTLCCKLICVAAKTANKTRRAAMPSMEIFEGK